jgi:hypothetical protein
MDFDAKRSFSGTENLPNCVKYAISARKFVESSHIVDTTMFPIFARLCDSELVASFKSGESFGTMAWELTFGTWSNGWERKGSSHSHSWHRSFDATFPDHQVCWNHQCYSIGVNSTWLEYRTGSDNR